MTTKTQSNRLHTLLYGGVNFDGWFVNLPLLLLRIYAGYTIMSAGIDKLPLPEWMTEQVIKIGFPFPEFFAWVASWGEFAFGFLLIFGLLSRFSGFMLAFIMGVASFGFQDVIPLFQMHLAQHFFWIFFLYACVGAGQYSLDYVLRSKTNLWWVGPFLVVDLLIFGLYVENSPVPEQPQEEETQIASINIPGNFNEWNPSANEMEKLDDNIYQLNVDFDAPKVIEFKFTANKSWDINIGETDQADTGFPIKGKGELNEGNDTQNIKAYIPNAGTYTFSFNLDNYEYTLDTLK